MVKIVELRNIFVETMITFFDKWKVQNKWIYYVKYNASLHYKVLLFNKKNKTVLAPDN